MNFFINNIEYKKSYKKEKILFGKRLYKKEVSIRSYTIKILVQVQLIPLYVDE